MGELTESFLVHARSQHEWPFPDQNIRNFAEATQRLTGPSERLGSIGSIEIHPVTEDRLDDWTAFFDHDAFVGKPEWAACYCFEPHSAEPGGNLDESPHVFTKSETPLAAGRSRGKLRNRGALDLGTATERRVPTAF